jgi:hypothetical protein
MEIPQLLHTLLSLGGFGALIGLIINILKTVGVVKDGQATNWATGLNLVLLVALFIGKVVGFDVAGLDGIASQFADSGIAILQLIVMIGGSRLFHNTLRGVPVVGRSMSNGN